MVLPDHKVAKSSKEILSAAFIATWPAIGWGPAVNAHRGLCSFDFGNGFALFIAMLGYIQLSVVLTSFIEDTREDWID